MTTKNQQFKNLLARAHNVLILLAQKPSGDTISAGYALAHLCEALEKKSTLALHDESSIAQRYDFLTTPKSITHKLSSARDMILSFNTKHNKISNIRTEKKDQNFNIYITPEKGSIDPRDFSFMPAQFDYDLVISIGAPTKASFGTLMSGIEDIFYEVPIINIDTHSENDHYGHANIVTVTASSTSEIIAELIEKNFALSLNTEIAEALLAGVITATDSFQNSKTTPKALATASMLMDHGADQQKIIKSMYKTHSLPLLKLWGALMTTLEWDEKHKLVWATIENNVFKNTHTNTKDIYTILEKTKSNYAAGKIFLILFEDKDGIINGIIDSSRLRTHADIPTKLGAKRSGGAFTFSLGKIPLAEAEKRVLGVIRG